MFILHFVRDVGDDDMKDESREESEVGENPDVGILGDDVLLAVEERKDHRNRHRGSIVQAVEKGSREEDVFFHGFGKLDLY